MAMNPQDRFRALYMSAQNVAHHERLVVRWLDLQRRSQTLLERSHKAREQSEKICSLINSYFPNRFRGNDPLMTSPAHMR